MRFGIVVGLWLLVLGVTAAPAAAGKGKKRPKPDLVVKEAGLNGQPFGFSEEGNKITFSDWTKNVGKGDADRSVTSLVLIRPSGTRQGATTRQIPKLKSGKSSNGSSERDFLLEPPLGANKLQVCADWENEVKEKNEENNCLAVPGHYFVIERIWSGSVGGTTCVFPTEDGACGPFTETFSSDNATFTFDQYLGDGVFNYTYRGVVFYLDQGAAEDCKWSSGEGANSTGSGAGSLVLDYLTNRYNATASAPSFYTISLECEDQPDQEFPGPYTPYFLQTSRQDEGPSEIEGQPLPFGHAFIQGSFNGPIIGDLSPATATWTWDLQ